MSRYFGWVEVHVTDHCNNHCRWCHNFSPFSPERAYAAEEYFFGLDVLVGNQVHFPTISLMGGEPFLHPDLPRFAAQMKERYRKDLLVTTNCFWLSEQDIKLYDPLWKYLNTITISVYPNMVKKLGGMERMQSLLDILKKRHPHLYVHMPDKYQFRILDFTSESLPIETCCPNSECTALLPDGRMARCGPGAFQHFAPEGTIVPEFAASEHMFYDLADFSWQPFWLWRKRYPMDACAHCSLVTPKETPWKVEPNMPYRKDMEALYHVRMAEILFHRGEHAPALGRLMETVQHYPDSKEALNDLGVVYQQLGRDAKARDCLRKALDLDPEFTSAKDNLAMLDAN